MQHLMKSNIPMKNSKNQFLPTNLAEGKAYYPSFSCFDVIFISGDPYYDHPLSGIALLARLLDSKGYKTAIIPQPQTETEFKACGQPRYFFCVSSGLLDSMLANYTPMLHQREHVLVPEHAVIAYTQKIKQLFSGSMTVIGGIEATIRRFTHFDYKENKLRRGILNDSKADLLLFGDAERSMLTLLQRMRTILSQKDNNKSKKSQSQQAAGHSLKIDKWDFYSQKWEIKFRSKLWGMYPFLGNQDKNKDKDGSTKRNNKNCILNFKEVLPELDLPSIEGAAFRISKKEIENNSNNTDNKDDDSKNDGHKTDNQINKNKSKDKNNKNNNDNDNNSNNKHKIKILPSYEQCQEDKQQFNLLTKQFYLFPDHAFIEPSGLGFIQHNRRSYTLNEEEMNLLYSLPFIRKIHPQSKNLSFQQQMTEKLHNSVVLGRGCWGSCSFCTIPLVQGKEIAQRSAKSILKEVEGLYLQKENNINDLTLPTLNMYGSRCRLYDQKKKIYSPVIEKEIIVDDKTKYCSQQCATCPERIISDDLYQLLEGIEKLNLKYLETSLELRSAIRHDLILKQPDLFRKIMQFTSRLKIAPEHIVDHVLKQMNKATMQEFKEFLKEYKKINKEQGTHKNLVPYFIAAHPGTTMEDMKTLRRFCDDNDIFVNLTQVFTPTPGTLSTATYYSGENPLSKEKVYIARSFREKKDQKNILLEDETELPSDQNN